MVCNSSNSTFSRSRLCPLLSFCSIQMHCKQRVKTYHTRDLTISYLLNELNDTFPPRTFPGTSKVPSSSNDLVDSRCCVSLLVSSGRGGRERGRRDERFQNENDLSVVYQLVLLPVGIPYSLQFTHSISTTLQGRSKREGKN